MRDEQKFEIERAFDLLPHVVGASWAVIWFRFNGTKRPTPEEFREKVIEYFELLNPVFDSYPEKENSIGGDFADGRIFCWKRYQDVQEERAREYAGYCASEA